jgi:hypothetical protein
MFISNLEDLFVPVVPLFQLKNYPRENADENTDKHSILSTDEKPEPLKLEELILDNCVALHSKALKIKFEEVGKTFKSTALVTPLEGS